MRAPFESQGVSIKILPPTRHIFRSKGDGDSKDLKALMDTRNKHTPREGGSEEGGCRLVSGHLLST